MMFVVEKVFNFFFNLVSFLFDFLFNMVEFVFDSFNETVCMFVSKVSNAVEIIMNFILDVGMNGLELFINSSEWAFFMSCCPSGSSSINNMVDLILDTFVRNFFLSIENSIKSELFRVDLSGII